VKPLSQFIAPMMASVAKDPFDSPDWIFETKLDGYRAIAVINSAGHARIWSRNQLPLEQKFPTVGDSVNQLGLRSTILDGEIVALDDEGIPRFQLLQKWQKRPTAPVVYFLFDLLRCDGRDLTGKTVVQRRECLEQIITPVAGTQVGGYVEARGKDLFRLAKEKGLEGIIAKRKASIYRPGNAHRIGSSSSHARSKSSSYAVSRKAKEVAASILERCYSVHTETESYAILDIRNRLQRKGNARND
jgi:bifunctional non-homologous end joining protein LigD